VRVTLTSARIDAALALRVVAIVVGGGAGIEYLWVIHDFHDAPTGPRTIASSGVKPRLLLSGGYGF
jgi:hypothetical protein